MTTRRSTDDCYNRDIHAVTAFVAVLTVAA